MKSLPQRLLEFFIPVLVLVLLLAAYDYGNRQAISNEEAVIAVRKFAKPAGPNDSIYMIVLIRGSKVWKTRVARSFFYSTSVRDRVILTREIGPLSGIVYGRSINDVFTNNTFKLQETGEL